MSTSIDSNNLFGTWDAPASVGQSLPLWLYRRLLHTFQTRYSPLTGLDAVRIIVQNRYDVIISDTMIHAVYLAFITLPPFQLLRLQQLAETDMQPPTTAATERAAGQHATLSRWEAPWAKISAAAAAADSGSQPDQQATLIAEDAPWAHVLATSSDPELLDAARRMAAQSPRPAPRPRYRAALRLPRRLPRHLTRPSGERHRPASSAVTRSTRRARGEIQHALAVDSLPDVIPQGSRPAVSFQGPSTPGLEDDKVEILDCQPTFLDDEPLPTQSPPPNNGDSTALSLEESKTITAEEEPHGDGSDDDTGSN